MKHFLTLAAAMALPLSPAYAIQETASSGYSEVDAEKLALAKSILEMAYPGDSHIALFQETADQMEAQMTQGLDGVMTDEGALEIVKQWQEEASVETDAVLLRSIPSLVEAWAISFAATYSKQELEDISAFVATPSGQAFMTKQTQIIAHPAFAEANQAFIEETLGVVTNRMPALIERLQAYEASKTGG